MASKKKAATDDSAAVSEVTTSKETAYSLSSLQKHCRKLFGVPTVTFVGATATLDSDGKYTISEIKALIDEWSKKEV